MLSNVECRVSGLDTGSVNVNIVAPNGTCSIENLDNRGNTFAYGQLDEFVGEDLQGCLEFEAPNNQIDFVILNHSGLDGWYLEFMNLHLTSGVILQCPYDDWLDNNDSGTLTCDAVKEETPSHQEGGQNSGDDWESWDF